MEVRQVRDREEWKELMANRHQKRKIWEQGRVNQAVVAKGSSYVISDPLITSARGQAKSITENFFPLDLRMVCGTCLCEVVRVGTVLLLSNRYEDKRHVWVLTGF